MEFPDALQRIERIAHEAGSAIQAVARSGVTAEAKADRSPVTRADRLAHATIVRALTSWQPGIPVVSEEGRLPGWEERRHWARLWLVDPLDGTKEFLAQNGEYTVNIALIEDGAPVLGVVHAPALGLTYAAARGLGAWKHASATVREQLLSAPPAPGTPLVVVESRSHPSAELEAYLRRTPVARRVRVGSSLKFCWVAEGRADLYPRFGPTMEWDTAAGDCVYRYSGRTAERESRLRYNTPTLRHERFVIGAQVC